MRSRSNVFLFTEQINEGNTTSSQKSFQFIIESIEIHYKIVIWVMSLAILWSIVSHLVYLPTFEAKSIIRVQTEQKVSIPTLLASGQGINYESEAKEIPKYLRYMGSEKFLLAVAQNLKLNPQFAEFNLENPNGQSIFDTKYWNLIFSKNESTEYKNQFLRPNTNIRLDTAVVAGKIAGLVKLSVDNEELISIIATSLDPQTSVAISGAYVEEFTKLNQQKDTQELVEVEKYIREKLAAVNQRIKDSEQQMLSVQERSHFLTKDGGMTSSSVEFKELERKLSELSIQQLENERLLNYYKNNPTENIAEGMNAKEVHEFRISELTKKGEELAKKYQSLKLLENKENEKFSRLPKQEQEYLRLKRQQEVDYDTYTQLSQKINQIEIQKFSINKKVEVDTIAKSASPSRRTNIILKLLFTILTSFFFSSLVALMIEWFDPTIKSANDFQNMKILKIGIIPRIKSNNALSAVLNKNLKKNISVGSEDSKNHSNMLVTKHNPKSIESMSFKYIRTRIQKQKDQNGKPPQVILITSPTVGDGKSFVACNLAVSFAQLEKKTIIIDTDFRHASVNRYFGIPNRKGLASVLKMEHTLDEVLVQDPHEPYLHILPADWGVNDPTELLSEEKVPVLIEYLKREYDYIIIDSPPIQMVVDSLVLSSLASAILVVGRYRKTLKTLLEKTYNDIINVNFQKIYGILNDSESSKLLQFLVKNTQTRGYGYGYEQQNYYTHDNHQGDGLNKKDFAANKASRDRKSTRGNLG